MREVEVGHNFWQEGDIREEGDLVGFKLEKWRVSSQGCEFRSSAGRGEGDEEERLEREEIL